jgi:hypothetical protein
MLVWMAVGKLCRATVDRGGEQTLARGGTVSAENRQRGPSDSGSREVRVPQREAVRPPKAEDNRTLAMGTWRRW